MVKVIHPIPLQPEETNDCCIQKNQRLGAVSTAVVARGVERFNERTHDWSGKLVGVVKEAFNPTRWAENVFW